MENLLENLDDKNNVKQDKPEKKERVAFFSEGGLYSAVPKTKKSLKIINIVAIVLGIGLIGLLIGFILL